MKLSTKNKAIFLKSDIVLSLAQICLQPMENTSILLGFLTPKDQCTKLLIAMQQLRYLKEDQRQKLL